MADDLAGEPIAGVAGASRCHHPTRLLTPARFRKRGAAKLTVPFQPLADGKPSGAFVVFADGFAGAFKEPGRAAHRPTGLAVGPDGALYISDDQGGRIWRVTYWGPATAGIEAAPAPRAGTADAAPVQQ